LFLYGDRKKSIDIEFLSHAVHVIQELDTKKRKIRSLRGFFLYALKIIKAGQEVEVLTTNCLPFFWRKVETIIRQNKTGAFSDFLFGTSPPDQSQTYHPDQTKEFKPLEKKDSNTSERSQFSQAKIKQFRRKSKSSQGSEIK